MLRNSPPAVRAVTAVLVLGAIAASAFVGVSLVGGGEGGQSPASQAGIGPTPPPGLDPERPSPLPTQDPSLPTQPADDTDRTPDPNATSPVPSSITISGVAIPIPQGSIYYYGGGAETLVGHWIQLGDSMVIFDDYGLSVLGIEASDMKIFEPTLDAIWALTQKVGTPSPPSLVVKGVEIPLPAGSYYSTTEAQSLEDTLVRYYVRFEHSVLSFEHWVLSSEKRSGVANNVRPSDEAKFQGTLEAIDMLTTTE